MIKKQIKKIAVVGKSKIAAPIALYLANSEIEINLILLSDEPDWSFSDFVPDHGDLLLSPQFEKNLAQIDLNRFHTTISEFDWIIFTIDSEVDQIKELLMGIQDVISPSAVISISSANQSIDLPINLIPLSIRRQFLGIRFFHPIRKSGLVELVSIPETDKLIIIKIQDFSEEYLGKKAIVCSKNGFAERLICFVQIWALRTGLNLCFDLEEINQLTGSIIGWSGKGIIKHIDMEGAENFYIKSSHLFSESSIPEEKDSFIFLNLLIKPPDGCFSANNLVFDPLKGRYRKLKKKKIRAIAELKSLDLKKRLPMLLNGAKPPNQFYREFWRGIFKYISQLIEKKECGVYETEMVFKEIIGWELGIFEIWDLLDAQLMVKRMEIQACQPDPWVYKMLDNGENSFFNIKGGQQQFYDVSGSYLPAYGAEKMITPTAYKDQVVWHNNHVSLYDLGDDVINLEIQSYRNIIDEEVAYGLLHATEVADRDQKGLLITSRGNDFSLGVNLGLVFIAAIEKNYQLIEKYIVDFQQLNLRLRDVPVPVMLLPKGLTLGGGCEMAMHCDDLLCVAETYIGLPEARAGLIPAGGGMKSLLWKLSHQKAEVEKYMEVLINLTEGTISNSAYHGLEMNYVDNDKQIIRNKHWQLSEAKHRMTELMANYKVNGILTIEAGGQYLYQELIGKVQSSKNQRSWTDFDVKIATHLARILSGGEVEQGQKLSEQYILDLERESFLSLCGEREMLYRCKQILSGNVKKKKN